MAVGYQIFINNPGSGAHFNHSKHIIMQKYNVIIKKIKGVYRCTVMLADKTKLIYTFDKFEDAFDFSEATMRELVIHYERTDSFKMFHMGDTRKGMDWIVIGLKK